MEGSVYLKARQQWDERYADLVLGKHKWQFTGRHDGHQAGAGLRYGLGQHARGSALRFDLRCALADVDYQFLNIGEQT